MGFFAEPVDEGTIRQMAKIEGPSSPFAKALAELDRRRAAGEDLVLVSPDNTTIMIVPRSDIAENVVQMPSRS
jgi:hypothetical protein